MARIVLSAKATTLINPPTNLICSRHQLDVDMMSQSSAITLAEGQYEFKTEVNLIFGNQRVESAHVLRTTLHSYRYVKRATLG